MSLSRRLYASPLRGHKRREPRARALLVIHSTRSPPPRLAFALARLYVVYASLNSRHVCHQSLRPSATNWRPPRAPLSSSSPACRVGSRSEHPSTVCDCRLCSCVFRRLADRSQLMSRAQNFQLLPGFPPPTYNKQPLQIFLPTKNALAELCTDLFSRFAFSFSRLGCNE